MSSKQPPPNLPRRPRLCLTLSTYLLLTAYCLPFGPQRLKQTPIVTGNIQSALAISPLPTLPIMA